MIKFIPILLLTAQALFAAEPLRVFAAAGTAPAMREIAAEFTAQTGIPVQFNFANAGVLARQILSGAPFDLFLSANEKWMDHVEREQMIAPETRTVLLKDDLVIIVPKGRSVPVDFAKPALGQTFKETLAIGDPSTPVGIYAKQAFMKLGWWDALQKHLCVGDTVNTVLNYVALGEADVGVVFHSIAFCAADRVDVAAVISAELHHPIRFPIAAAAASPEAVRFLEIIQQECASSIFEKYGWTLCRQ